MPSPLRYLQLQLRNGKVGEGNFVVYHSLKQLSYLTLAGVHSDAKLEAMIGGCRSERAEASLGALVGQPPHSARLGKMLSELERRNDEGTINKVSEFELYDQTKTGYRHFKLRRNESKNEPRMELTNFESGKSD